MAANNIDVVLLILYFYYTGNKKIAEIYTCAN